MRSSGSGETFSSFKFGQDNWYLWKSPGKGHILYIFKFLNNKFKTGKEKFSYCKTKKLEKLNKTKMIHIHIIALKIMFIDCMMISFHHLITTEKNTKPRKRGRQSERKREREVEINKLTLLKSED